ncbi:MAG: amidohydrolase family protein [Bryobacteraceae bacterium]
MPRWTYREEHTELPRGSNPTQRFEASPERQVRRRTWRIVLILLAAWNAYSADRHRDSPKIDMHLHALEPPPPGSANPFWLPRDLAHPATEAEMIRETVRVLQQFNVVKAVTSGRYQIVDRWKTAAPDRIIPALHFVGPENVDPIDLGFLRQEFTSERIAVFGEVVAQLFGLSPSDNVFEPYFALCEELDIPVAIHTGFPPPGAAYYRSTKAARGVR